MLASKALRHFRIGKTCIEIVCDYVRLQHPAKHKRVPPDHVVLKREIWVQLGYGLTVECRGIVAYQQVSSIHVT
jgi:hypothetical protein